MRIAECTVGEAKARGILEGLELCWKMGFRKIEVESDAKLIGEAIKYKRNIEGNYNTFASIHEMLNLEWQVQINHVYREGNYCADRMATIGWEQLETKRFWQLTPEDLQKLLPDDLLVFYDLGSSGI
ncbi:uncharacterized protein LOC114760240 [Neltuma alba]|uniref:uncharacterized protein LOC114760240 n=1 Tax=Neltuma alba TaxID=207710 RepID=UPI0010A4D0D5|nr:uncharacterized protein LOC114760240 [Prosopis alba]